MPQPTMPPTTRDHVNRIRFNLGPGGDFAMGRHTLIVGPNGSIKTMLLRAVELALTGRASDIAGREDVAQAQALLALAPGRAGSLVAEATLSDGGIARPASPRIARWAMEIPRPGHARRPVHILPDVVRGEGARVFPLRALRDAVRGSPETARAFLLPFVLRGVTTAEIEARIAAGLRPRFVELRGVTSVDPIADLRRVRERAREIAAEKAREARGAQLTLDGVGGMGTRPTAADIDRAALALDAADARVHVATVAEATAGHRATAIAARASWVRDLHAANAELIRIDECLARTPESPAVDRGRARIAAALLLVLGRQAERPGPCACCGGPTPVATTLAANTSAVTAFLLAQADAVATEERRAALLRERERAAAIEAAIRRRAPPEAPAAWPTLTDGMAARADQVQARGVLESLRCCERDWLVVDRARDTLDSLTREAEEHGRIRDACDTAIRELLDQHAGAFAARVQAYLPPTDRFGIRVREGDVDVCQFGLWRTAPSAAGGDVLHTALSGAEWTRVTVAMACVTIPADARLAVIIPEDRAFDPMTLAATMRALSVCPWQILWASPIRPAGRVPAGWTILDVGAEGTRFGPSETPPSAETPIAPEPEPASTPPAPTRSALLAEADDADEELTFSDGSPAALDAPGMFESPPSTTGRDRGSTP